MDLQALAQEIEAKKQLVASVKAKGRKSYASRHSLAQEAADEQQPSAERKRTHDAVEEAEDTSEEDVRRRRVLQELDERKRRILAEEAEEAAAGQAKEEDDKARAVGDEEMDARLAAVGEPEKHKADETRAEKYRRLLAAESRHAAEARKQAQAQLERDTDYHIVAEEIRDDTDKVYIQARKYLRHLLQQWDASVAEQDEAQQGLLLQVKRDIVPLLARLRQKSLDPDVFASLATTLKYLQDKDYLMSNDAYLKLSIGNACWPIGVINIGIHARSAHSRLTGQQNRSNIMSDEKTRKWLMSLKRLITFAEKKWPN